MQAGRFLGVLIRAPFVAALLAAALGLHAKAQAQQPPSGASRSEAAPKFDILEFVVEGDTLLGAPAIERAVYRFMGPDRSVSDAEGARAALEAAYQSAGYLSVSVLLPPQTVGASGEVRLQVLAAPVEKLRVEGAEHVRPSRVRDAVPSLAPGSVPAFDELQQELGALARANPDLEATPVLGAGSTPGTMSAELKLDDKLPLHGSVEVNNRQSLDTTAGRVSAAVSYDDLFQRRHSLSFNWLVSPREPDESDIASLAYALPLGGEGDRLSLAFTRADTDTPTSFGGATVSRGNTWTLRWRDQLAAPDGVAHGLSWGATYRRLRDRPVEADGTSLGEPELRYTTFSLGYDLVVGEGRRLTQFQAEWTVSPAGLNRRRIDCYGTQREQFACKRADGEPGFQTLGFTLSHREPIGNWLLLARLQGQFADAPLVSSEQIVFGGQDSVRGYYEGEQAADAGLALRLELATPGWSLVDSVSAGGLLFADAAYGLRLQAQPPEQRWPRLASAGLGLRLDSSFGTQAQLVWARVLKSTVRIVDGALQPVSGSEAGRGDRWEFHLRQSF